MSKTLSHEHIKEAIRTRTKCECGAGYMQKEEVRMPCPNPNCRHGQGIGPTHTVLRWGEHSPGTPTKFSREKCYFSKDPNAEVFWLWEPKSFTE